MKNLGTLAQYLFVDMAFACLVAGPAWLAAREFGHPLPFVGLAAAALAVAEVRPLLTRPGQ